MTKRLAGVGVASAVAAAAFVFASPVSAAPERDAASASFDQTTKAKPTRITTDDSQFGTMLFDGGRQAIYSFDKEKTKRSKCYGSCAKAWPPVLTKGKPKAHGEADQGLLGTTKRRNGTTQVTYAGKPLYFYAHEGPGQVFCHDVKQFGGLWLVVRPDGTNAD